jgi:hypothetical protein
VRIFRAGTELGIRTVAVFAHEDRFSIHRYKADEAYQVGQGKGPVAAYLDIESIVGVAKEHGVDAIHPGYGFLSENAEFARACQRAGIIFVGPRPELLEMMGDKTAARALAKKINVPVLPGTEEPVTDRAEALRIAKTIGFPLIIKAAFGGGGRGMRVVHQAADLDSLLDEAQDRLAAVFNTAGFDMVYFDGGEDVDRSRFDYYVANFQANAMRKFRRRPIIHMGTIMTHGLWHSFARSSTVDTYLNTLSGAILGGKPPEKWPTVRDHIDQSVRYMLSVRADMMPGELGWFGIDRKSVV